MVVFRSYIRSRLSGCCVDVDVQLPTQTRTPFVVVRCVAETRRPTIGIVYLYDRSIVSSTLHVSESETFSKSSGPRKVCVFVLLK